MLRDEHYTFRQSELCSLLWAFRTLLPCVLCCGATCMSQCVHNASKCLFYSCVPGSSVCKLEVTSVNFHEWHVLLNVILQYQTRISVRRAVGCSVMLVEITFDGIQCTICAAAHLLWATVVFFCKKFRNTVCCLESCTLRTAGSCTRTSRTRSMQQGSCTRTSRTRSMQQGSCTRTSRTRSMQGSGTRTIYVYTAVVVLGSHGFPLLQHL